ncbi:hypothetical protein RRG08_022949 [Elysia crispata]|uniref:FLYWCH-type domain-containing protein n=1 Tax=Elysia crispata TaxID=231223 RepID=A0AAE0ZPH1_9GAST|nr:hypothetical protein RRG08_022949 [Elysia crispata]
MDVSFKTYETKFSTLAPLVDGYKFVLLKKNKTTIQWKCSFCKKTKCTKRISTDKDITMVLRADGAHNHAAESEHSIEKQDLQQRCKKRAREEPEEKASNIIINVLKKDPLDIMPNEFESIRQSLYQERRKQYPKCPTSIEDTRNVFPRHYEWAQSQYFQIFTQTGQSASTDTNETQRHRAGETSKKKRQKKLKKESHWDKVSKQYKEGKITKFEYVKQMSYKLF